MRTDGPIRGRDPAWPRFRHAVAQLEGSTKPLVLLARVRSAAGAAVRVTVGGIPAGVKKVLLEHYRIDDTHSNSYTVWKAMGSPQAPTPEQYARLQEAGQLQLLNSPEWLDVSDGKVTIETNLPRQATSLMRMKW